MMPDDNEDQPHPDDCYCDDCCRCAVCQHPDCLCWMFDDDGEGEDD